MKKTFSIVALLLCMVAAASAQTKAKWIKGVRTAQAMAYAYDEQGELTGQSNAVFVGNEGKVLTQYDILRRAARVQVIDAKGKRWDVTTVDAANSLYNVARLNTNCTKVSGLKTTDSELPAESAVLIVPAPSRGGILCKDATITAVHPIAIVDGREAAYYTVKGSGSDETLNHVFAQGEDGLPVMTVNGELLGLLQLSHDATSVDEQAYAVSALYVGSLATNGMSAIAGDYTALSLPVRIPDDEEQARTFLFLHPKTDVARYENVAAQYIQRYPTSTFGYITLAEWYAQRGEHARVDETYQRALDAIRADGRDEILFSMSRYQYAMALKGDSLMLNKAYENVLAAYDINPEPAYKLHEADLLYARREYGKACETYMSLADTPLRSHTIFTSAAQCASMMQQDSATIALRINLLDSAVNCFARPYPAEAATAVWMRAAAKHDAGRYREAVHDYNEFEHLMASRVSAEFYYIRSTCELSGRLFQQALDDATRATLAEPDNVEYLVHNANVYLRIGEAAEARPLLERAAALGESAAQEWLDAHPAE